MSNQIKTKNPAEQFFFLSWKIDALFLFQSSAAVLMNVGSLQFRSLLKVLQNYGESHSVCNIIPRGDRKLTGDELPVLAHPQNWLGMSALEFVYTQKTC